MNAEAAAFVTLLRSCARKKDLCSGACVHAEILKSGSLERSTHVAESLVNLYAKCDVLPKAHSLLDGLRVRGVFCWTEVIAGYIRCGQSQHALRCYEQMQKEGISADVVTFTCILKVCGSLGDFKAGRQIHDQIAQKGLLHHDVVLGTSLVDMYAKCGAPVKAHLVLDELPFRDVISWNALITGYMQQGQGHDALYCFEHMQQEGLSPNVVTFTCALKACGSLGAIDKGEEIHQEIMKQGLLRRDVALGNALVDMYIKCDALAIAQQVLTSLPVRDVVSWSALIGGYAQQGQGQDAWDCFEKMQSEGLSPNSVTLTCLLKACGSMAEAEKGERIHDEIVRQGLLEISTVLGNALVDMYAKCGALVKAQRVLDALPVRNVVSWSTIIAGYVRQGQVQSAMSCMERMQQEGLSPNAVTFTCMLKACGSIGAAERGEMLHDDISRQGFLKGNIVLASALIDMYVKCGELAKAQRVLEEVPSADVICWSALIAGYAQQGYGEKALECFNLMHHKGLSPDTITFSCVLNACSHSGLVREGEVLFESMSKKFGVQPDPEHYVSMVALFGQAGHLDKAVEVIQRMPSPQKSAALWFSLMGACKRWGDTTVARWAFEQAVSIHDGIAASHAHTAGMFGIRTHSPLMVS